MSLLHFQLCGAVALCPAQNGSCRIAREAQDTDSAVLGPLAVWGMFQGSHLQVHFKMTVYFEPKVRINNKKKFSFCNMNQIC